MSNPGLPKRPKVSVLTKRCIWRVTGYSFCWSTALPKLHFVKSAIRSAFKFSSFRVENHFISKELKIVKIFVLLNFQTTEGLLSKRLTGDNSAPLLRSRWLPYQEITCCWVCLHIHSHEQTSQSSAWTRKPKLHIFKLHDGRIHYWSSKRNPSPQRASLCSAVPAATLTRILFECSNCAISLPFGQLSSHSPWSRQLCFQWSATQTSIKASFFSKCYAEA